LKKATWVSERDTSGPKSDMVAAEVSSVGKRERPHPDGVPSREEKECRVGCAGLSRGVDYSILAMDLEGTEICEWLNSLGVTACWSSIASGASGDSRDGPLLCRMRSGRWV